MGASRHASTPPAAHGRTLDVMAPVSDAPTAETGYAAGIAPIGVGIGQTSSMGFYVEELDANPDLAFPLSALVYDRMRKEDGQVGSILRAITLPITEARWHLNTDGVRPAVTAFVDAELGLNVDNAARRRRQGIVWREHLRQALLCLPFGFMPFEQVYNVDRAAPGLEDPDQPGRLYAHLRKLGPRMPRTLTELRVARDGGLAGIVQAAPAGAGATFANADVVIPVDRLVMYVNDREGAEWTGTSILRTAYKHWLVKDQLVRLGAQIVERNGMGVPVVTYPEGGDRARALQIATEFRSGAMAGAALETGWTVALVGVTGSTADELPRVTYHDQAMSRSLLAMFLDLGHSGGLGESGLADTLLSVFLKALGSIVRNIADTATEHIIRDLVELNYGPDEPYPSLVCERLTDADTEAVALKALADAGLLTADATLEDFLRDKLGLPAKPDDAPPVAPPVVEVTEAGVARLAEQPAAYVAESARIRERRATPEAQAPHAFRAAKWTHPNGHPRCALCGDEERTGGRCLGAAHDGLKTSSDGSAGVTHASADPLLDRLEHLTQLVAAMRAPANA